MILQQNEQSQVKRFAKTRLSKYNKSKWNNLDLALYKLKFRKCPRTLFPACITYIWMNDGVYFGKWSITWYTVAKNPLKTTAARESIEWLLFWKSILSLNRLENNNKVLLQRGCGAITQQTLNHWTKTATEFKWI